MINENKAYTFHKYVQLTASCANECTTNSVKEYSQKCNAVTTNSNLTGKIVNRLLNCVLYAKSVSDYFKILGRDY